MSCKETRRVIARKQSQRNGFVPAKTHQEDTGLGISGAVFSIALLLRLGRLGVRIVILAKLIVRVMIRPRHLKQMD